MTSREWSSPRSSTPSSTGHSSRLGGHPFPFGASGSGVPVTAGAAAPSTTMPSTSGAFSLIAFSTASSSVDDEAAQPSQLPTSRRRTIPSSTPSSSTLPPCDSMYGRTSSSAATTRSSTGTG